MNAPSSVRDQLRSVDFDPPAAEPDTTTKPPPATPAPAPAPAKRAPRKRAASAGKGTGKAGTPPVPAQETPETPAPAAGDTGKPAPEGAWDRLKAGGDPELYLMQTVGRAELGLVGRPLNLGNPPAYLRKVLDEHCDRSVMPMRTLVFALLDVYAREQGWLGEQAEDSRGEGAV